MHWAYLLLYLALCRKASCIHEAANVSSYPLPTSTSGATTCINLRAIGTSNCSLEKDFSDNLTRAIAEKVSTSCNCSFFMQITSVICFDNTSIVLHCLISSNQVDIFVNWMHLSQTNAHVIGKLIIDTGVDVFPAPPFNGTSCYIIAVTPSLVSSIWFAVCMAGGGAVLFFCSYNLIPIFIKLKRQYSRKRIMTKISELKVAIPNPIELYVHKSPNPNANGVPEASSYDEKESYNHMDTLESSFPQHHSLKNISKIDELTFSELAAEKCPCVVRPDNTTQQKEMEGMLSNPSTDHCDRPSIELITIDPNPDNKQTSGNETKDLNSKDLTSHNSPETGVLLPKKGPKKSVSFAEHVIPSTKETIDQKTFPCDSAINEDVPVESIKTQIASKRPNKGNVLSRWNFSNNPEKQTPPIVTNMSMADSDKSNDGSDGVLLKRGLVADIARKWNTSNTSDDHTSNNLNPATKRTVVQCSTNQLISPTQTNQPSRRGSAQSNGMSNKINSLTISVQNDLLSDQGITLYTSADKEVSNLFANSSEQDSAQSHNADTFSEHRHQQTLAHSKHENTLLEEKNPFAYNLEALLNIPSRSRNQSSERDSNTDTITQLSVPILDCSNLVNGSHANGTTFSTALEASIEDATTPLALTLPSTTFLENGPLLS